MVECYWVLCLALERDGGRWRNSTWVSPAEPVWGGLGCRMKLTEGGFYCKSFLVYSVNMPVACPLLMSCSCSARVPPSAWPGPSQQHPHIPVPELKKIAAALKVGIVWRLFIIWGWVSVLSDSRCFPALATGEAEQLQATISGVRKRRR